MKGLRIGIDAHLITYRRGIGNCVYNLIAALAELPAPHQYILYAGDPAARAQVPDDPRFSVRVLKPAFIPLWEQIALPRAVAEDRLDLLHCQANTGPLRLPRGLPLLLTIHDVMFLLPTSELPASPSLYQRMGRRYYRYASRHAARRAAAVVTVSNFSRTDIVRRLRLPADRVHVIHNAANAECRPTADPDETAAVLSRVGITAPYVVALGAVDPRKNTARVLEAFAGFHREGGAAYRLLLCGLPAAQQAPFREQARALGIEDAVTMTGFVTTEEMADLYHGARMLVYPSLYEGFGMPVLEAMTCGTPIVTSCVAAIPEVAGEAAVFVDPLSVASIRAGMARVAADHGLRDRLVAEGHTRALRFSWRQSAEKLLKLYEETASPS